MTGLVFTHKTSLDGYSSWLPIVNGRLRPREVKLSLPLASVDLSPFTS